MNPEYFILFRDSLGNYKEPCSFTQVGPRFIFPRLVSLTDPKKRVERKIFKDDIRKAKIIQNYEKNLGSYLKEQNPVWLRVEPSPRRVQPDWSF